VEQENPLTVRFRNKHVDFLEGARITKLGWVGDPIMRMSTNYVNQKVYDAEEVRNAEVFEIVNKNQKVIYRLKPMARTTSNKFIYWGITCVDPNDPLPKVTTPN
jgi:hypothetical protein